MKRRIGATNTGLGGGSRCLLPNTLSDNEKLNKVCNSLFLAALKLKLIDEYGGFDFKVESTEKNFSVDFGIEPTYQYDPLLIYHIEKNLDKCGITQGKAMGAYGTDVEIIRKITLNNNECDEDFKILLSGYHDKLLKSIES